MLTPSLLSVKQGADCRYEVHVGIAGVPSSAVHVHPPLQPDDELALAGLDVDTLAQGVVLETGRDVDDDLAPGQPALAPAVDVRIGDLAEPDVAAQVEVECVEVRVDLVVVPIGLVRHALGGAEVDPAGHRLARVLVDDHDLDPVLAAVEEVQAHSVSLGRAVPLDVSPADAADGLASLLHGDGRRRDCADLHVRRASHLVLRLAPARVGGGQELVGGLARQGVGVLGASAIDLDLHVEGLAGVLVARQYDPDGPHALAGKWLLVGVAKGHAGDDQSRAPGHDLDRLDHGVRVRAHPSPKPVALERVAPGLELAPSRATPLALVPGHGLVVLVRDGEELGVAAGYLSDPGQSAYLEALSDSNALLAPASEAEHVVGHVCAPPAVFRDSALENGVGEYDTPRSRAYGYGDAAVVSAGGDEHVSLGAVGRANYEGYASHGLGTGGDRPLQLDVRAWDSVLERRGAHQV